ncbi:hypothetical protein O1G22_41240 [Streptomyces camelliae]|uniref:Uncharacterized protein n=1 Tax=Streptomyces camelliae TaxID=3004093 RepID=A0ABY7PDU6_9ACTN|nr:hypothetical protein [Streptomyces sp. HUAS 2-6]WBO68776.1 hypothetical protein O1G22_41240 [Streptomyces sp. HUAS 2-6]
MVELFARGVAGQDRDPGVVGEVREAQRMIGGAGGEGVVVGHDDHHGVVQQRMQYDAGRCGCGRGEEGGHGEVDAPGGDLLQAVFGGDTTEMSASGWRWRRP